MHDVVASFFEDVDDAAQEEIEENDMAFGLADEEDVWVLRVSVHRSDSADWQANVSAQLASHSSLLEAVYQDFSLAALGVLLIHVFLEASSEVGVSAVPADIGAREVSLLLSSLPSIN